MCSYSILHHFPVSSSKCSICDVRRVAANCRQKSPPPFPLFPPSCAHTPPCAHKHARTTCVAHSRAPSQQKKTGLGSAVLARGARAVTPPGAHHENDLGRSNAVGCEVERSTSRLVGRRGGEVEVRANVGFPEAVRVVVLCRPVAVVTPSRAPPRIRERARNKSCLSKDSGGCALAKATSASRTLRHASPSIPPASWGGRRASRSLAGPCLPWCLVAIL